MKVITFKVSLTFSILLSTSIFGLSLAPVSPGEQTDQQSPEYQLRYLYHQRDAMLNGLDNLSRKICFSSRITTVGELSRVLSGTKKKEFQEESANAFNSQRRLPPENLRKRLILPIANGSTGEIERKKSRILNRMIANSIDPKAQGQMARRRDVKKVTEEGAGENFSNHYYRRRQCIVGEGLENACKLLTSSKANKEFRELRAKLSKHKFYSSRFDGMRACAALSEKKRYRTALQKVQNIINKLEESIKDSSNSNNSDQPSQSITGGWSPDNQIKRDAASTDNAPHIDLIP